MRVLHIDTGREMRGGQRQVLMLIKGLEAEGHRSVLLCHRGTPLWQAAQIAGHAVYQISLPQLWRRSADAELVHAHDARAHTLAALIARRTLVVSRRVAFPVQRSILSKWKYSRPARFLAVSRFVANQLRVAGVAEHKIDVVYDGVEPMAFPDTWNAENPAVALATNDPQKGRDLVREAASRANLQVIYSDDLVRHLHKASMFVYITRSEGLGSAALLAMRMGVPVIASRVGGLTEVIVHGESGLLVDNDPLAISGAMRRLVDDPQLTVGLIERARAQIDQSFTSDNLVRRTLNAYRRALGGG